MAWWDQGQGTPWGGMDNGKPETPKLVMNPWELPGMDQTGQLAAMQKRIALGAGRATENARAGLQRAGIAGGADSARAGERIAEAQAGALADAEANLQNQDYNQRMGLAQLMNQAALQRYGIDSGNYNAEQAGRGQFWQGAGNTAGQLGGALISAKYGRKVA